MLEKIGIGILTKIVPGFLKGTWDRVKNRHQKSKNASHDYGSPYKKRHGQLIVTCVGMESARPLDDVYVAVQFLDKRRAATHRGLEDIEKAFREREELHFASASDKPHDGMRAANNEQYLMVLGGPGVGKSTFLRKVGLEALKEEDGSFEYTCTPVFLELKRFTEDQINIESRITDEFKVCGYPYPEQMTKSALKSGELLILFDGLDEIPTPNVNNVFNKIRDFVDQYSENRFIISCRPAAYTGGFTGFAVVEVAEFDDTQIQAYINNWFALGSNRKTETAQRCWEALDAPEHQAVRALAQNPLSLTLLCTIYEDSQSFPSNRTILYERILNIFLKKWTAEKHIHRDLSVSSDLDISTVKKMLPEIAAKNFKVDSVLFSENELINQIQAFFQRDTNIPTTLDASKTLDTILVDPGLFVERTNGIYSFLHLTFQEYLTANYFVSTQSIQQLVADHLHDERWREVFLFTAELLPEGDSLLIAMETEATKCVGTDRLKTLFGWAERITNTTDTTYNEVAKRAIAIHQYFSLWLLNKIYTEVKNMANRYQGNDFYNDHHREFHGDLYIYQDLGHYRYFYRAHAIDPYLDRDPYGDLYRNLDQHGNHYKDRYPDFCFYVHCGRQVMSTIYVGSRIPISIYTNYNNDLYIYQDPYQYTDTDFYPLVSSEFGGQFDEELDERITLIKSMEQVKIFKGVDLQRMVQRFKVQQKYIKAAGKGEFVEPPVESIHDTWLSVLHITDDMLAISRGEMENYVRYLRAIELTVACKEAAGCVSPKVWQRIEDRFLTVDAEGFEG